MWQILFREAEALGELQGTAVAFHQPCDGVLAVILLEASSRFVRRLVLPHLLGLARRVLRERTAGVYDNWSGDS